MRRSLDEHGLCPIFAFYYANLELRALIFSIMFREFYLGFGQHEPVPVRFGKLKFDVEVLAGGVLDGLLAVVGEVEDPTE